MHRIEDRWIVLFGLVSYIVLAAAMALYGSDAENADSVSAIDDVTVKHIGPVWVPYSLWPLPRREKAITIHMVPGFTYRLREVYNKIFNKSIGRFGKVDTKENKS